ncbi:MAG: LytTR family DNA-binding domain-containing protein [bacterium]|nr:LytTR family DNA-binding domain-containing protein [bacterium]
MINCIAIDDEPLALEIIETFCAKVPFLKLEKTFTDPSEAAKYLRKFPVDLLFLDIQMPDKNGIDFYKEFGEPKMVIFSTAYSEYAVEGFNLSAIDYLLKPVEFQRFLQAVTKAHEYYQYTHTSDSKENRFLFVRSEYSLVKIPFAEILYIETLDDYIKIHMAGKKPVLTKMNLKNVLSKLDPNEFIRIHRSYIVPLSHIVSVRGKTLKLGTIEIPIGVKFEEEFLKIYAGK